jgi:hypothetical protein
MPNQVISGAYNITSVPVAIRTDVQKLIDEINSQKPLNRFKNWISNLVGY